MYEKVLQNSMVTLGQNLTNTMLQLSLMVSSLPALGKEHHLEGIIIAGHNYVV